MKYSNRIFRIFIKSYICILLVPIIVCVWAYSGMYQSSLDAEKKYLEYALSQFSIAFDGELSKIHGFATTIMLDKETADLAMMNPPGADSTTIAHALKYKEKLSALRAYGSLVYDQLVYLHKPNMLFSVGGRVFFDYTEYWRSFVHITNISEEEWTAIVRSNKGGFYTSGLAKIHSASPNKIDAEMNLALYSLPFYSSGIFRGSAIVLVRESAFLQFCNQFFGTDYQGTVSIFDDMGEPIFQSTAAESEGDVLVITNTSSVYPLRYIAQLPNRIVLRNANAFLRRSAILLSCALALGGVLAYLFARRYGRPLDHLGESLRTLNEASSHAGHRQAIRELDTRVQALISSHQTLSAYLSEHMRVAERLFYEKLYEGSFNDENQVLTMLNQLNLPAIDGPMTLAVLSVTKSEGTVVLEDSGQFAAAVKEASIRYFPKEAHRFDVNMNTITFILPDRQARETEEAIDQAVAVVNSMLAQAPGLFLQCIVSEPVLNYIDLGRIFARCIDAQSGRLWSSPVVRLRDIRRTEQFHYPIDEETRLINAVMQGQSDVARTILDRLYQVNYGDAQRDIRSMKMAINSLSGTLNRVRDLLDPEQERPFLLKIDQCLEQFESCGDPNDLFAQTSECLAEGIRAREDVRRHRQAGRTRAKTEQIKAFIEEHFAQADMGLALIADQCGLSQAYLSKLFKEQEGINLSIYIERRRIEYAKELLHGGKSIEQIALQAGYAHPYSFRTAFKRAEGMTPGEYRNSMRGMESKGYEC